MRALTKAKGKMYETVCSIQNTPVRHALPSLVQTRAIHHKHSFERIITWCKRERGVTYEEISGDAPGYLRVHPRRSNARTRRWTGKGSGIYTFRYKFLSCPLCRGRAQHSTDTVMSPIRFYYQELGPEIKCTGTSAWTSAWSTAWSTTEGSGALRSTAEQSGAEN